MSNPSKIHFISYGDSKFEKSKKRISEEAQQFGVFDTIKIYSPQDLDKDFLNKYNEIMSQPIGGGFYIWKLQVVKQSLKDISDGDFLIYLDSGCRLNIKGKDRFNEFWSTKIRGNFSFNCRRCWHVWNTSHK